MGKITFITGGARSGKSHHAEQMAKQFEDVAYIATALVTDGEMEARIKRHRADRPADWTTLEAPYDIAAAIREHAHTVYLIDCVTVHITNLLLRERQDWNIETLDAAEQDRLEEVADKAISAFIDAMEQTDARFIVVSNEVGMGLVPAYPLGRIFRDLSGRANRMLAQKAEQAYFVVSGMLLPLKQEAAL